MSRNRIKKTEDNTDINISPMIDMVFILLIFFIVTTVFVDEIGIKVDKPQPKPPDSTEDQDRADPIVFNIQANGQVLYQDDQVTMNQVQKIVREVLSRDDVPVILEVQRNALSGLMVQVIDASYAAQETVKISVTAVD